jgi:hypothetical protein
MEDVMLGTRRTILFWQQRRRRLLALERALASFRADRATRSEYAAVALKAKDQKTAETKSKAWLFRG